MSFYFDRRDYQRGRPPPGATGCQSRPPHRAITKYAPNATFVSRRERKPRPSRPKRRCAEGSRADPFVATLLWMTRGWGSREPKRSEGSGARSRPHPAEPGTGGEARSLAQRRRRGRIDEPGGLRSSQREESPDRREGGASRCGSRSGARGQAPVERASARAGSRSRSETPRSAEATVSCPALPADPSARFRGPR